MHKGLQWAIAGMLFVIMIAVAVPQFSTWYKQIQSGREEKEKETLRETERAIEAMAPQSNPVPKADPTEDAIGNLYSSCRDTGDKSSLQCLKYIAYLNERHIPVPEEFR